MSTSGDRVIYNVSVVLVVAAVLACVTPAMLRRGMKPLVIGEFVWLGIMLTGNLAGLGHSDPFNSILGPGIMLTASVVVAPAVFRRGLTGEQHDAAVSLRLPVVLWMVGTIVWCWVEIAKI